MTYTPQTAEQEAIEAVLAQAYQVAVLAEQYHTRNRTLVADNFLAIAVALEDMVVVYEAHLVAESGTGSRSDA